MGALKEVVGDNDMMKRRRRNEGVHIRKKKRQTCRRRKIPFTLLLSLQLPSRLVSKTERREVIFYSQLEKNLFFDKSWPIRNMCVWGLLYFKL